MLKIVSGAQTDIDRAVLEVAMKHGVPCGGWCPRGRKAEDGVIPDTYPVQALAHGGHEACTRKNIQDSDGTVVMYFEHLGGATVNTHRYCMNERKPHLLLDGASIDVQSAAQQIRKFLDTLPGQTLNFTGQRASDETDAYAYVSAVVESLLASSRGDV